MKCGTPIEIKRVWAKNEEGWFSGYTYIRPVNENCSLIESQKGLFTGMPFSMLNSDIRPKKD